MHLVKYWAEELVTMEQFIEMQSGSCEIATVLYADRRLDMLAELVGEEAVQTAVNEAKAAHPPCRMVLALRALREAKTEAEIKHADAHLAALNAQLARGDGAPLLAEPSIGTPLET